MRTVNFWNRNDKRMKKTMEFISLLFFDRSCPFLLIKYNIILIRFISNQSIENSSSNEQKLDFVSGESDRYLQQNQ